MKPACMTLSHSLCRAATFISQSFLSLSPFLSSSQPLFVSSSGKCIDSPLFVLSPTHIQLSQRGAQFTELMELIQSKRRTLSSFPKNETPEHLFSFSLIWMKNARNVCRWCLKVTGGNVENRRQITSFADSRGKKSFLNQSSAVVQLQAQ